MSRKARVRVRVRRTGISAEAFVTEYMRAHAHGASAATLAKWLGVDVRVVHSRAAQYRTRGVKLPRLRRANHVRPRARLPVAKLNAIVRTGGGAVALKA